MAAKALALLFGKPKGKGDEPGAPPRDDANMLASEMMMAIKDDDEDELARVLAKVMRGSKPRPPMPSEPEEEPVALGGEG